MKSNLKSINNKLISKKIAMLKIIIILLLKKKMKKMPILDFREIKINNNKIKLKKLLSLKNSHLIFRTFKIT